MDMDGQRIDKILVNIPDEIRGKDGGGINVKGKNVKYRIRNKKVRSHYTQHIKHIT